jgi:hypothetical protein
VETLKFPDRLFLIDGGISRGSRVFILESKFRYISSKGTITVPSGFPTDGASCPRIIWPLFSPLDSYFGSAVVHDFLYSPLNDRFTRAESDRLFLEAMTASGVDWFTRSAVYGAVRLFGWRFFRVTK